MVKFAQPIKNILLILILFFSYSSPLLAQDNQDNTEEKKTISKLLSHFNAGLEIQTKYVWRGIEYGTAPTVFPSLSYSIEGFSIYGMGGYAWNGSHSEVDFGASYSRWGFTLGINDYYYPTSAGEGDSYFNYKGRQTGHWWEGVLTYAPDKIPVWATISTYFAGADKKPSNGKQAWSTYAEIGGRYDFKYDMYISLAVGAALNKSFYNDYEHGFSVCNINLKYGKDFSAGAFTFPVGVSMVINPYKNKTFFSFNAGVNF